MSARGLSFWCQMLMGTQPITSRALPGCRKLCGPAGAFAAGPYKGYRQHRELRPDGYRALTRILPEGTSCGCYSVTETRSGTTYKN